jgi:hypothetical protein
MAVVLREDHEALARRVCEGEQTARTYAGAAEWLQRESAHLRKIARLLDTAGGRLAAVVSRCGGPEAMSPSAEAANGAVRHALAILGRASDTWHNGDPAKSGPLACARSCDEAHGLRELLR